MEWNPKKPGMARGWYHRGRMQHFDPGETNQFITFRLFDSVPEKLIRRWESRIDPDDPATAAEYRKKIERFLDRGYGECYLRQAAVAKLVRDSLYFHDGKKHHLICWVIMPNHVHVLLRPLANVDLAEVMHSIKSYTAHEANKLLRRSGQFWQHESFDRYIRNTQHFHNVIRYIERNPVKARLCKEPADWPFSSASKVIV
ncbi:MAG: transposase [Acidobacteria bacterium]|nr:transposase [Acidobacteriota bacterium]